MRSARRALVFVIVASVTAMSLLASAQPKKPAVTAPVRRPAAKPAKPPTEAADDAGPLSTRDERAPSAASRDGGATNIGESKTLDGGTRLMRFGEVEVEGRLKSPQIVYFLRRVRAEFAAGDLGHRTFVRELSETRNEPRVLMRGLCASLGATTFAALLATGVARAETKTVETTYEIENLDAYPDHVFVAWPRNCGSTGDPLGAVSLELNPGWVARAHEVDYEVIEKGRHDVLPFCRSTMRIHALPRAAFPQASRVATVDDASLGKKPGDTLTILPALDAIELPKRASFFAGDPRQVTSPFRFDEAPATAASAKTAHFVLAANAAFVVEPKHATYTFEQAAPRTVDYPLAPNAVATADAGADAGVTVAVPAPAPAPAAPHDLGTRWVYAAAILGLIAGGLIARYRKNAGQGPV